MNPLHACTRPLRSLPVDFARTPVAVCLLVLLVAAMSFGVHLLDVEVERSQEMREAQRAGKADATPARLPSLRANQRAQR